MTEVNSASSVSRRWYRVSNNCIFRPRCIHPRPDNSISWKAHYNACEALNQRMLRKGKPERTVITQEQLYWFCNSRVLRCTLVKKHNDKRACFAYHTSGRMAEFPNPDHIAAGDFVFQIIDLESGTLIRKIDGVAREWVAEVDFCYPYLLTRFNHAEFIIRDVSQKEVKALRYKVPGAALNFFISKNGVAFSMAATLKTAKVVYAAFEKGKITSFEVEEIPGHAMVVLLHQKRIIYSQSAGLLSVRDLTKKGFPLLGELRTPERTKYAEKLDAYYDGGKFCYNEVNKATIKSTALTDSSLVTISKEEVVIWDLERLTMTRTLRRKDFNIDAIQGHTLFIRHDSSILAIDSNGNEVVEWEDSNMYQGGMNGHLAAVCGSKVYLLEKERRGHVTLVAYDFAKPARVAVGEGEEKEEAVFNFHL